jgi:hypothetical protein
MTLHPLAWRSWRSSSRARRLRPRRSRAKHQDLANLTGACSSAEPTGSILPARGRAAEHVGG